MHRGGPPPRTIIALGLSFLRLCVCRVPPRARGSAADYMAFAKANKAYVAKVIAHMRMRMRMLSPGPTRPPRPARAVCCVCCR